MVARLPVFHRSASCDAVTAWHIAGALSFVVQHIESLQPASHTDVYSVLLAVFIVLIHFA